MGRGYKKRYTNPGIESNLKPAKESNVVNLRGAASGKPKLRAMGSLADDSMQPGEYRVRCESAKTIHRGGKFIVVLKHKVCEGAWRDGVLFSQWISLKDDTGIISPATKYAKQCAIALGHDIETDEDLDPEIVFVGREFLTEVGYRLSSSDKKFADENAAIKKDDDDFLRVHSLLNLVGGDSA